MLAAALFVLRGPARKARESAEYRKGDLHDISPTLRAEIAVAVRKSITDDDGIRISLKTPGHEVAGDPDFCPMCHGAGGIAVCTPTKCDELHNADTACDMDAATGYKRGPGSAGAHPLMRRASNKGEDYYFMKKQAGSLVPAFPAPATD